METLHGGVETEESKPIGPFVRSYLTAVQDSTTSENLKRFGLLFARLAEVMKITSEEQLAMSAAEKLPVTDRVDAAVVAAVTPVQRQGPIQFHFFLDAVRSCTGLGLDDFNRLKSQLPIGPQKPSDVSQATDAPDIDM